MTDPIIKGSVNDLIKLLKVTYTLQVTSHFFVLLLCQWETSYLSFQEFRHESYGYMVRWNPAQWIGRKLKRSL
jgi:hypothetical protein